PLQNIVCTGPELPRRSVVFVAFCAARGVLTPHRLCRRSTGATAKHARSSGAIWMDARWTAGTPTVSLLPRRKKTKIRVRWTYSYPGADSIEGVEVGSG